MFCHSAQIYYWLEKCQTEPRESLCWFVLLPVNLSQAALLALRPHPHFPVPLRPKSSFPTHRTACPTLNWDDGNILPSIITAAVSLTGARESELSGSRLDIHTHAHLDHEEVPGLRVTISVLIRRMTRAEQKESLAEKRSVWSDWGSLKRKKKPSTCGVSAVGSNFHTLFLSCVFLSRFCLDKL